MTPTFKKTDKQKEAVKVMASCRTTLLEGGSRSGKTFISLRSMLIRALRYDATDHLVCRFRFNHAKQSICFQTMPRVFASLGMDTSKYLNKSEWIYTLPNNSNIWIGGLDDKERTEKILGMEYATIFENEASQISYDSHEILSTRLNPPPGVPGKNWIDYNPPSIQHWGYKIFHTRKFPDGRDVPDGDYKKLLMNPIDNPYLSKEYLDTLSMLSAGKRLRFEKGEYSMDSGSLWKRAWIKYGKPPEMVRVVIGVDPSGTVAGDEVGIIVAGIGVDDVLYILDDYSCHGTPAQWAAEVVAAYNKWKADIIVAEKNFGGDMVTHTIQTAQANTNVKLITSSRGKIVRAEPVSAMYEHGKVLHRIPFLSLEDEYCIYEPGSDFSPNRLDAAVFALTELSGPTIQWGFI